MVEQNNMSNENVVAQNINAANDKVDSKLDASVKKVLSLRPFLARILKGCVKEYSDIPIEDIENKYIEGDPIIASIPVHQDEVMPVIVGSNTEQKSIKEGTVTFDLKFDAIVPNEEGYMQLIVNVEGQNTAGYPLIKRGIYYCGRMLSAQYGTVFKDELYEKLRKVISIWVCFKGNKQQRNTINRYSLKETHLCGSYQEHENYYNMVDVVILYVGDDRETDNELLKMLDKTFSSSYNVDEKKRFLHEECGINLTKKESKEVDGMCNYSSYVYECGEEQGKEIGKEIGRKEMQAKVEAAEETSINLAVVMHKQGMSVADIAKAAKVSVATVQEWLKGKLI